VTGDEYILSIISKYKLATGAGSPAYDSRTTLYPLIQGWAKNCLLDFCYSGSYAKGTGIKGSADVDFFISLTPETSQTLKQIYDSLYSYLASSGYTPRRQNVSIGITHNNLKVDLVPGKKQSGNTNDHSLWRNKAQTWTQTNIKQHIDLIQKSGRIDEIRAIKIWRNIHNLEFPSFYLELSVLNALSGKNKNQPENNVWSVLNYLKDNFLNARIIDPANSANIISTDLTNLEKQAVQNAAANSLQKKYWTEIIW